jgi:hypothetical protein
VIDVLELRKGKWITTRDGDVLIIQGAYMSGDGVVITAKADPAATVARNVPLEMILEVRDAK